MYKKEKANKKQEVREETEKKVGETLRLRGREKWKEEEKEGLKTRHDKKTKQNLIKKYS